MADPEVVREIWREQDAGLRKSTPDPLLNWIISSVLSLIIKVAVNLVFSLVFGLFGLPGMLLHFIFGRKRR